MPFATVGGQNLAKLPTESRALTSSEATYATAVYNHELARLQLEQATGALEMPSEGGAKEPVAPPAPDAK